MRLERPSPTTQEILDSGAIPKLRGYKVGRGKVSDLIFGGKGHYVDKETGARVEFENPPLMYEGLPARIMVRTERVSTHDIGRGEIPMKDQILASNHNAMRRLTWATLGTSQFDVHGLPDNAVVIVAENLKPIPLEMVVRAYMAKTDTSTSLYVHYMRGERVFCGHQMPEGLIVNGKLPTIIDTPSTKSEDHDESISPDEVFKRKICTPAQYDVLRRYALQAFGEVSDTLAKRGVILVDVKTEHGIDFRGEIVSMDELYTLDSARFWTVSDYEEQLLKLSRREITELSPASYSKQFAREFSKGTDPYTPEQRVKIAVRYIEGIERLLGAEFVPDLRPKEERVIEGLRKVAAGID